MNVRGKKVRSGAFEVSENYRWSRNPKIVGEIVETAKHLSWTGIGAGLEKLLDLASLNPAFYAQF